MVGKFDVLELLEIKSYSLLIEFLGKHVYKEIEVYFFV